MLDGHCLDVVATGNRDYKGSRPQMCVSLVIPPAAWFGLEAWAAVGETVERRVPRGCA